MTLPAMPAATTRLRARSPSTLDITRDSSDGIARRRDRRRWSARRGACPAAFGRFLWATVDRSATTWVLHHPYTLRLSRHHPDSLRPGFGRAPRVVTGQPRVRRGWPRAAWSELTRRS